MFIFLISIDIRGIISILLEKKASFHLWFVYSLIGVYLIAPFLSGFLNINPRLHSLWFVLIGVFFLVFKYIITYLFGLKLEIDNEYFYWPIVYFVLGFLLKNLTFKKPNLIRLLSFFTFLGSSFLAVLLVQHYSLISEGNKPYNFFFSYSHPIIMVSSISIFMFFQYSKGEFMNNNIRKLIESLSKYSFGIYLVPILVRSLLNKGYFGIFMILRYKEISPSVYIIFNVLIIFLFSYLIVLILDKITLGKLTKILT